MAIDSYTVRLGNIASECYAHVVNWADHVYNTRLPGTPIEPIVRRVVEFMKEHATAIVTIGAGIHAFSSPKPLLFGALCGLVLTASGNHLSLRTFHTQIFRSPAEQAWLGIALAISKLVFRSPIGAFFAGIFAINTLAFTPALSKIRELTETLVKNIIKSTLPTGPIGGVHVLGDH